MNVLWPAPNLLQLEHIDALHLDVGRRIAVQQLDAVLKTAEIRMLYCLELG